MPGRGCNGRAFKAAGSPFQVIDSPVNGFNEVTTMPIDSDRARLVMDVLGGNPTEGIPIWIINPMEWRMIDRLAGVPEGTYVADPVSTYRKMLENSGVCMVDQWIPDNPLSIT